MEDRYLYKAKTTPKEKGEFNNVWVTGNLIVSNGKYYIHPVGNVVNVKNEIGRIIVMHEVIPDTICRCTGLKDKNGKLIWENDIAKLDVYYYEKLKSSIISQIIWCNDLCALSLVVNDRGTRGTLGHLMDLNKEIEVIGNIFDNPELLK
jgi:uncharacterized phage protein (TIGR01671 family)